MGEKHQRAKERAARLLKDGKFESALEVYREIVAEDPSEIGCWAKVGELAQQLGLYSEALPAFQKVADRYAKDGFLFKAITTCKQILQIEPGHTETQEMLASLYASKRSPGETSKPVKRVREAAPNAPALQELVTSRPSVPASAAENTLPRTPLFSELPESAFKDVVAGLTSRRVEAGRTIIVEGERGHSMFILSTGRVRVEKGQPPVLLATLSEGAFFGEMALLQDSTRTASVIAEEDSEILELDRAVIDRLIANHPPVAKVLRDFYQQRLLTTATAVHPFFQPFSPSERRVLIDRFRARSFAEGEVVIKEGEAGRGLFLLLSGGLEVWKGSSMLAELGPGEMVGEMSLLRDAKTTATVRSATESWLLRLSREDFREVAGERPEVLEVLERVAEERLGDQRSTGDLV